MQAKHEALGSTQGGGGCTLCLSCEASRNHTLKVYRVFCSSCPLNKHIYILGFNVNLFRFLHICWPLLMLTSLLWTLHKHGNKLSSLLISEAEKNRHKVPVLIFFSCKLSYKAIPTGYNQSVTGCCSQRKHVAVTQRILI